MKPLGNGSGHGFTLIEILVVVAIAAVLAAGAVLLAAPADGQIAEREARRLASLLELALVEARASGEAIAWRPEARGYAFLRRNEDGDWTRFSASSPLRPRSLPEGIRLRAQPVALQPFGLGVPLEATVEGGGRALVLRGGVIGHVSLERL